MAPRRRLQRVHRLRKHKLPLRGAARAPAWRSRPLRAVLHRAALHGERREPREVREGVHLMSRRRVAPQEGATGRELKAIESENAKTESAPPAPPRLLLLKGPPLSLLGGQPPGRHLSANVGVSEDESSINRRRTSSQTPGGSRSSLAGQRRSPPHYAALHSLPLLGRGRLLRV